MSSERQPYSLDLANWLVLYLHVVIFVLRAGLEALLVLQLVLVFAVELADESFHFMCTLMTRLLRPVTLAAEVLPRAKNWGKWTHAGVPFAAWLWQKAAQFSRRFNEIPFGAQKTESTVLQLAEALMRELSANPAPTAHPFWSKATHFATEEVRWWRPFAMGPRGLNTNFASGTFVLGPNANASSGISPRAVAIEKSPEQAALENARIEVPTELASSPVVPESPEIPEDTKVEERDLMLVDLRALWHERRRRRK